MAALDRYIEYRVSNATDRSSLEATLFPNKDHLLWATRLVLKMRGVATTREQKCHFPPKSIPLCPASASTSDEAKADWTI